MNLREVYDKNEWKTAFTDLNVQEFLQSWEWGEFQKKTGKAPLRLLGEDGGKPVALFQGFEHHLGLGLRYLYLPRIVCSQNNLRDLFNYIRPHSYLFMRIEPSKADGFNHLRSLTTRSVNSRQPTATLFMDLNKLEERLLLEMHHKTRYNIGLARKKGVEIREEKNVNLFWLLHEQTSRRDDFSGHQKAYYEKMLEMDAVFQISAFYKGEAAASNIYMVCGDRFTYLHGASSDKHKESMAPYLLMWEAIKKAKVLGAKIFDFWGIAPVEPDDNTDSNTKKNMCFNGLCWPQEHPWSGITRFKVGFGGEPYRYPNAFDVILRPGVYQLYRLIHGLRAVLRR